jgi:hypothetical protein
VLFLCSYISTAIIVLESSSVRKKHIIDGIITLGSAAPVDPISIEDPSSHVIKYYLQSILGQEGDRGAIDKACGQVGCRIVVCYRKGCGNLIIIARDSLEDRRETACCAYHPDIACARVLATSTDV